VVQTAEVAHSAIGAKETIVKILFKLMILVMLLSLITLPASAQMRPPAADPRPRLPLKLKGVESLYFSGGPMIEGKQGSLLVHGQVVASDGYSVVATGNVYVLGSLLSGAGPSAQVILTQNRKLRNVVIDSESVRGDGGVMDALNADSVDGWSLGEFVPGPGEPVTPTGFIELSRDGGVLYKIPVVEK
jgi:hypothetical protein